MLINLKHKLMVRARVNTANYALEVKLTSEDLGFKPTKLHQLPLAIQPPQSRRVMMCQRKLSIDTKAKSTKTWEQSKNEYSILND